MRDFTHWPFPGVGCESGQREGGENKSVASLFYCFTQELPPP